MWPPAPRESPCVLQRRILLRLFTITNCELGVCLVEPSQCTHPHPLGRGGGTGTPDDMKSGVAGATCSAAGAGSGAGSGAEAGGNGGAGDATPLKQGIL